MGFDITGGQGAWRDYLALTYLKNSGVSFLQCAGEPALSTSGQSRFLAQMERKLSNIISVFQVKSYTSAPGCYYCREMGVGGSEISRVHFLEESSVLIPGEVVLIQVLQSSETVP